jgi:hypothetical protein
MVSVEVVKKNLRGFYTKLFKSFLNDFLLGIDEYFKDEKIVSLEDIKENLHDINDIDINSSVSAIILKIYEKIEFHFQEIFEDPKCVKNYGINVNKIHDFLSQIEDWVLKFEGYLKPYDDITAPIKKTLYNLKSEITRKEEEFETYIESINEEKIRTEGKTVIDKHIKRISEMLSYYQQEISKTLSEEFPELKSVRKLLKQYKQETLEIEKEVAQIIEDMKSKGVSPYSVMKEWEEIFHEKTKQMKFALSLMVSKLFNSFKDVIKEEELFFETMKNIQLMEDDIPLNFRFSFVLPEKLTEEKLKERIMAIRSQISLLDKLRELYSVELDKFENYVISKIKDRDKISSETCVVCHKKLNFSMDKFIKCPFCNSVMHYLCIAWWLESHGTCPVCNNNYLDPTSNMYSD